MKNKYFEQKNFVKNYIYAITIFIITLVIGISIFFNVVQSSIEKNSRETLIFVYQCKFWCKERGLFYGKQVAPLCS